MCGIAGFTGSGDTGILQRMTDAIAHRGPDADGHWVEESAGVFLGHRRLSIVDLSGGAQPMWTADGQIGVIFNGEIYNHADLRTELKARGCVFQTDHSDTEVLLHGYREWGENFIGRLNGMWAFVIYDRAKKTPLRQPRSFREKAALLLSRRRHLRLGERIARAAPAPALPAQSRRTIAQEILRLRLHPRPAQHLRARLETPRRLQLQLPARSRRGNLGEHRPPACRVRRPAGRIDRRRNFDSRDSRATAGRGSRRAAGNGRPAACAPRNFPTARLAVLGIRPRRPVGFSPRKREVCAAKS
jgi:hypothetical protein